MAVGLHDDGDGADGLGHLDFYQKIRVNEDIFCSRYDGHSVVRRTRRLDHTARDTHHELPRLIVLGPEHGGAEAVEVASHPGCNHKNILLKQEIFYILAHLT